MTIDKNHGWLRKIKDGYDKIAGQFAQSRNYVWRDSVVFLDYIKDNDRVLDLGCGNGRLVPLLRKKNIDYVGVDASQELIKIAGQNYPELDFQTLNAVDLDDFLGEFNAIVSVSMLNHLTSEYHGLVFKKVFDRLVPGGYFLLSNWNMWNENNKKGVKYFQKIKQQLTDKNFQEKYGVAKNELQDNEVLTLWGDDQVPLYYYAFTIEELKDLAEKNNFEIIKLYYSQNGQSVDQRQAENIVGIFRKIV